MKLYRQLSLRPILLVLILAVSLLCMAACSKSSGSSGEGLDGKGAFSDEDLALNANRYGDGTIPEAQEGGLFDDLFFDYDSSSIRPEYHPILQENAKVIQADPTLHAEIEGHCDKRGTNEYNLALGERRAKAVAALLVSYGARASQLSTISYGEEIPLDPGDSEAAYSKNRRVHFALSRNKMETYR